MAQKKLFNIFVRQFRNKFYILKVSDIYCIWATFSLSVHIYVSVNWNHEELVNFLQLLEVLLCCERTPLNWYFVNRQLDLRIQISLLFVRKMARCRTFHGRDSGIKRVREIAHLKNDVVNKRMDVLEPDCSFRYHSTYTCYKQYTDRRKLPSCSNLQIDEDVSVSIDNEVVDDLSHFVHNYSTRSQIYLVQDYVHTSIPCTLTAWYEGATGF